MTPLKLADSFAGDAWTQAVKIVQAGNDFTGYVLDVVVDKDGAESTQTISVAGTQPNGASEIDAVLSMTKDQTAALGVGTVTGRLRVSIPGRSWGPFTLFYFTFNLQ